MLLSACILEHVILKIPPRRLRALLPLVNVRQLAIALNNLFLVLGQVPRTHFVIAFCRVFAAVLPSDQVIRLLATAIVAALLF